MPSQIIFKFFRGIAPPWRHFAMVFRSCVVIPDAIYGFATAHFHQVHSFSNVTFFVTKGSITAHLGSKVRSMNYSDNRHTGESSHQGAKQLGALEINNHEYQRGGPQAVELFTASRSQVSECASHGMEKLLQCMLQDHGFLSAAKSVEMALDLLLRVISQALDRRQFNAIGHTVNTTSKA